MSTADTTDGILDSNAISPTDKNGRPIPVTIPVMLAPGVRVVYTTRLGGVSQGDAAGLNLGGKNGDDPKHVAANRAARRSTPKGRPPTGHGCRCARSCGTSPPRTSPLR